MPNPNAGADQRALPPHPNLEHLRNEAKQLLSAMRAEAPRTKLADAQFRLARAYGFASWRQLKAEIDRRAREASLAEDRAGPFGRYVGHYRCDPERMSNMVLNVTQAGGRLFVQMTGAPRLEVLDRGGGVFALPGLTGQYEFDAGGTARARALIIRNDRGTLRLERTTAAAARQADAARASALVDQARTRTPIALPAEILDRYVGHYSTDLGPALEITRDADQLFAQVAAQPKVRIHAESESEFFYQIAPVQLSFVVEAGRGTAVILHENGGEQRLPRVSAEAAARASAPIERKAAEQVKPRAAIKLSASVLARYVGRYSMAPQRVLTVTAEQDRLFAELTGQSRYEVYPESEHDFFWTVVAAQISFIADRDGQIRSAVIHQAGRDIPLARIDQAAA